MTSDPETCARGEPAGHSRPTIPKKYKFLGDACWELLVEELEKANDVMRDRVQDRLIRALGSIIRMPESKRRLPLWTRGPSGEELEQVDWNALAISRSVDWHATIVSGHLIVLSDPHLKAIEGWPLFVTRLDWYNTKARVAQMIRDDEEPMTKVSDDELQTWWVGLSPREQARAKDELHEMARTAFAGRGVSRERIRLLSGFRKPGPKRCD